MTKEIENIYHQIQEEIITLKREPGSLLKEVDIVRKFNISRTPVRDILSHLECDKLIATPRSNGTYISKIDMDYISDIIYVRSQIEISILKEIIDSLTPGDIVKLKMIVNDQEEILHNDHFSRATMVEKFLELEGLFIKMFYQKAAKESIYTELAHSQYAYKRYLYLLFSSYLSAMIDTCHQSEELILSLGKHNHKKATEICCNQKYIGLEKIWQIKVTHPNYFC